MKVLVACEESQRVTIEFRNLGIEAYSCDIQDCSGGYPEWHINGDAIKEAYNGKYDMMIAHPPCTYLSNVAAPHLYPKGILNQERYKKGLEAKEFFMKLLNAPIKRICIENPVQSKIFNIPKYNQVIEPYYFGDPFKKKTCLWLKNLPHLKPTNIIKNPESTTTAKWYNSGGKDRQKNRSKTFIGIARAIASQWSQL
jgi:hypothetical protein